MKKSKQICLSIFLVCCIVTGNAQDFKFNLSKNENLIWNAPEPLTNPVKTLPEANSSEMIKLMPTATCFCKVSYNDLTNQQHATGVLLDLTSRLNLSFSGLNPQNEDNRNTCNQKCTDLTASLTASEKQSIADQACASGVSNGTIFRSYSAVGTKDYKTAQYVGKLTNTPAVSKTTYTCPATWASNTSNQLGGITTDGKCKKLVCQPISISPLPPDGTAIGTWGFTWGNASFAWGNQANGGAAVASTIVISPKICKIQ